MGPCQRRRRLRSDFIARSFVLAVVNHEIQKIGGALEKAVRSPNDLLTPIGRDATQLHSIWPRIEHGKQQSRVNAVRHESAASR